MNTSTMSSSSNQPSPTPTLTTLPPELLLHIISFLPCSADPIPASLSPTPYRINTSIPHHTTLLSLLLTSHSLSTFIQTHLPTIFNAHIRKHHAPTARYFHPRLINDWFVPAPRLESPAALETPFRTWLGRDDVENLTRARAEDATADDGEGNHDAAPLISLSSPGPWFARFLEEYDFEIRVHVDVFRARVRAETKHQLLSTLTQAQAQAQTHTHTRFSVGGATTVLGESNRGAGVGGAELWQEENEDEAKMLLSHPLSTDLAFRLSRYCVRPFLLRMNGKKKSRKDADDGEGIDEESFWDGGCGAGAENEEMGRVGRVKKAGERVRGLFRGVALCRRRGRECEGNTPVRRSEGRKLCFGEVEKDTDEEEGDDDEDLYGSIERTPRWSRWRKFTCGISLCCRLGRHQPLEDEENRHDHDDDHTLAENEKHLGDAAGRFRVAERKLHSAFAAFKWWRGCGRVGRFEVLE